MNGRVASPANKRKGLPGFLRRSVRTYENDGIQSAANSDPEPQTTELEHEKQEGEDSVEQDQGVPGEQLEELASNEAMSTAEENASESGETEQSPPSSEMPANPPGSLERKVSYKDSMFEKTISADVVNMSDLRRLSWNGIPVSETRHESSYEVKHPLYSWGCFCAYFCLCPTLDAFFMRY